MVRTLEEQRALEALKHQCDVNNLEYKTWNVLDGGDFGTNNPEGFLKEVSGYYDMAMSSSAEEDDSTEVPDIVFALDLHKLLQSPPMVRALKIAIEKMTKLPISLVMLSSDAKLPVEVEREAVVYDFKLPTVEDLEEIGRNILVENEGVNIEDKHLHECCIAARGLTAPEAINAFTVSLVTTGGFDRELILAEKLQAVKKSGLMEIYEPEDEANVGGLAELKQYIHARKIGFEDNNYPTPKGLLMVGPPGSGKSLAAKMVAKILGVPLLRLDFSSLKSRYVGDSEARVKQVLNLIDVISPCAVWLDKVLFN